MSTTSAEPTRLPIDAVSRRRRRRPGLPAAGLALAVALGCLARLHSPSALWLDEALSVGISRLPLPELFDALRRDGSPPLYYLLLHAWIAVFGQNDTALRALSAVFSLATLPILWLTARQLAGPLVARSALLLLAVSPFAVRYATETRMYALIQLLSALGLLVVLHALRHPSLGRLLGVSIVAGLLALTHYWALFLLATTAVVLVVLIVQGRHGTDDPQHPEAGAGPDRRAARRTLLALLAGGVLFLPWLPTFLYQIRHTGTPWAAAPRLVDTYKTLTVWSGGGSGAGVLLTLTLIALAVLALCGRSTAEGVLLSRPLERRALLLLAGSMGTLLVGLLVGMLVRAGYAPRYSAVAIIPGLLLAALGLRVLARRGQLVAVGLITVTGLAGVLSMPFSTARTQAAVTARTISARLTPGDLVLYCPDQLGPAVSRLLPTGSKQAVYPTLGSPQLVDWVDYAQRNRAASPNQIAATVAGRTGGAIWLVWANGYRTFGRACEQLGDQLGALRGPGEVVQRRSGTYDEQQQVTRYPARSPAAG